MTGEIQIAVIPFFILRHSKGVLAGFIGFIERAYVYKNNLYDYSMCFLIFIVILKAERRKKSMSELNILQQNIDKPNTVTEEDIVVTRDNQTFTIKGRFNGEEGVFTYDADVQPNDQLQFLHHNFTAIVKKITYKVIQGQRITLIAKLYA